jgi:hypothetical protein
VKAVCVPGILGNLKSGLLRALAFWDALALTGALVECRLDKGAVFFEAEAPLIISDVMKAKEIRLMIRNLRVPLGERNFILFFLSLHTTTASARQTKSRSGITSLSTPGGTLFHSCFLLQAYCRGRVF